MLVCLLLMASISYAQSETIVVGKKADGTDLKAQCYTFPQRVETFSFILQILAAFSGFPETDAEIIAFITHGESFHPLRKSVALCF